MPAVETSARLLTDSYRATKKLRVSLREERGEGSAIFLATYVTGVETTGGEEEEKRKRRKGKFVASIRYSTAF